MADIKPKLTVIINNHNYEEYLRYAIESVLKQKPRPELVIVDDCSTDRSVEIISEYAEQAKILLLEENVGQGGAFSASFNHATGNIVLFLDSDDFMLEGATSIILENYETDVAIYHYRMRYADRSANISGMFPPPERPLARGDISSSLRTIGSYTGTVTSGMVLSKKVLDQILPMPNPNGFRQGGDGYLTGAAPLYGRSKSVNQMISAYRLHGRQQSRFSNALAKRARYRIKHANERYKTTKMHAARLGLEVSPCLGERDSSVLLERMVSLLLDAEHHPIQDDTISELVRDYRAYAPKHDSKVKQLFERFWWSLFTVSPMPAKRQLIRWRIEASTRPAWIQSMGRYVRERFRSMHSPS